MLNLSFSGNLATDVTLRDSKNGDSKWASFRVAVNRYVKGENVALFISCVAYGQNGEFVAKHYKKGDVIEIAASEIEMNEWTTKTGEKRTDLKAIVNSRIGFPPKSRKKDEDENGNHIDNEGPHEDYDEVPF